MQIALAILLIGLTLMPVSAHVASEPISATMSISPSTLTGPASVRVNINIMNTTDDGQVIPVTLLDPAGNVCSTFGSGGTANLGPNAASVYSGNWLVTQQQLESGRVTYTARYTFTDENGMKSTTQQLISQSITHNKVEARLHIERVINPGPKVQQGQTITISYAIKNIGTVDVSNITFTDPGVISQPVVYPFLAVNGTADVSYTLTAGAEPITTHADVTFEYQVNEKTETSTVKVDSASTIEVQVPDLLIQLTGQQIVNKGDKVDLTYVITNKSDLSYEQIKITDVLLNDIETNLSIKPQQTYTGTHSITVNENATYQFTLTGVDSTGSSIIYQSNQLTIQTTESVQDVTTVEVIPVVLHMEIEADRPVIYEEPGEIIFRIKVTNNGIGAVENVALKAVNTTFRTVDRIEPGQTIDFVRPFSVSVGGQFQFTATAKDNTGADHTFASNIVTVPYEYVPPPATMPPTPAPTQAPAPEPPFQEATEDPSQPFGLPSGDGPGIGSILLYALAGVFGLVLVGVILLFVLGGRKSGGQAKVIDSIERVPHRDYSRAPSAAKRERGTRKGDAARTPPAPAEDADAPEPPADQQAPDAPAASTPDAAVPQAAGPATEAESPASVYERPRKTAPKPNAADLSAYMPPSKRNAARREAAPIAAQLAPEQTEAETHTYQSEYLSRIRGDASGEETAQTPAPRPEARQRKPGRDAEEEALLSGSTGEYRLSRRSASVRPEVTTGARSSAGSERPETDSHRARRQRGAERPPKADVSQFYDDDEEIAPPPKRRR